MGMVMNCRIIASTTGSATARLNQAQGIINTLEPIFRTYFYAPSSTTLRIKLDVQSDVSDSALNMRSGCAFTNNCTAACGDDRVLGTDCFTKPHHRALGTYTEISSSSLNTFRFVDFVFCEYDDRNNKHEGGAIGEASSIDGRDMIVSLSPLVENWKTFYTTAHEISHMLGARHCTREAKCIMNQYMPASPVQTRDFYWCNDCVARMTLKQRP